MSFFIFANITINRPLVCKLQTSHVMSPVVIILQGVLLVQISSSYRLSNLRCTLKELIYASQKLWKKIAFHFSKSKLDQCIEMFFVQVHASVLMMPFFCLFSPSGCYYSGDDTPFFNANTIGTFVDISLLDRWLIETTY